MLVHLSFFGNRFWKDDQFSDVFVASVITSFVHMSGLAFCAHGHSNAGNIIWLLKNMNCPPAMLGSLRVFVSG